MPGGFGDWLPSAGADATRQSFPSGHMATAVGLAWGLSALYPRGRWLFATLAIFVGCQRLDEGSHYLSDLVFGAAVGSLVAAILLSKNRLSAMLDQREAQRRSASASRHG